MVDFPVRDYLNIKARNHSYSVHFFNDFKKILNITPNETTHFIVDKKVAMIYKNELSKILHCQTCILITASERSKSFLSIAKITEKLINNNIKRDHTIVAIGGGVIQDITCFISSVLMRGVPWQFIPTTLLAQADSCIGSKSSINFGTYKNILGTFNPPQKIFVYFKFLDSLTKSELQSGVGEMLKVAAISGGRAFNQIALDYVSLQTNFDTLKVYIKKSLLVKKTYIEKDEFDKGVRIIFNYGHSFGHAIEAATNFKIPHGIAVTIGMDLANYIAFSKGLIAEADYSFRHRILKLNYRRFKQINIPIESFYEALLSDKKNTVDKLGLILPSGSLMKIKKIYLNFDKEFRKYCRNYIYYLPQE